MPQFSYKARRRSGEVVQGVLDVADRGAALLQIERQGLFPVSVDAGKGSAAAAAPARGARPKADLMPPALRKYFAQTRKPKLTELATYTNQLANLLQSGMPLTVALNSMTHLSTKGIPAEVSKLLKQDVMEGKGLSEAMAKQNRVFSELYINMVKAGEQSGSLVEVLRRLGDHFERFAEVQTKLKSALVYPAFVCLVGAGIVVFFITFMLPRFMEIFKGFNIELPLPTRMLISFSNFMGSAWALVPLMLVITTVVVFMRFKATPNGKRTLDRWKLNMPVFGKVNRMNLFGQFARTLSTLLHNGVPVLTALKITEDILSNVILKEAIAATREAVTDGKTLAQPLAKSKIFPQLMVDLVKIGEETGDVPGALRNLATTYESELSISLRVMTNLIEPVLIMVMAIGVGFLLLAVLSAMFKITSNISATSH